jgi:hypothetical protein
MVQQSLWDHLNVPLPDLDYEHEDLQEGNTTTFAAHSYTPLSVSLWTNFETLVEAAGNAETNLQTMDANVQSRISNVIGVLGGVIEEEDVTTNTYLLLENIFNNELDLKTLSFLKTTRKTLANPDIIACEENLRGEQGGAGAYSSPQNRAQTRRDNKANTKVLFPFETKPFWKFRFLGNVNNGLFSDCDEGSAHKIVRLWAVPPEDLMRQRTFPAEWSAEKIKVFHLIRQLYGQLVSDNLKYGVIHIYELWWFCCRDALGNLQISRAYGRQDTNPSVLQAIKTLDGFQDEVLEERGFHPASATKVQDSKPSAHQSSQSNESSQKHVHTGRQTGDHSGG